MEKRERAAGEEWEAAVREVRRVVGVVVRGSLTVGMRKVW